MKEGRSETIAKLSLLELRLVARSKLHQLVSVATVGVLVLQAGAVGEANPSAAQSSFLRLEAESSASARYWFRIADATWYVLLFGLLFGYGAITTDRDRGSILTVMSLPVTRGEYFAAKLLAYGGAFALVIGTGCVLGGIAVVLIDSGNAAMHALATAALVQFGTAAIAVAVGISAVSPSRRFALTAAIFAFVVTVFTAGVFALNGLPAASAHPFHLFSVLVAATTDSLSPVFGGGFVDSPAVAIGAMYGCLLASAAVGYLAIRREVVR